MSVVTEDEAVAEPALPQKVFNAEIAVERSSPDLWHQYSVQVLKAVLKVEDAQMHCIHMRNGEMRVFDYVSLVLSFALFRLFVC